MLMCPTMCPMLNQYGYCRDTMRTPERSRVCPHQALNRIVRKPQTAHSEACPKWTPERGRTDGS